MRYIEVLEECPGRKATMNSLPLQRGDVPDTYANMEDLVRDTGYKPTTSVDIGVRRLEDWFRGYFIESAAAF